MRQENFKSFTTKRILGRNQNSPDELSKQQAEYYLRTVTSELERDIKQMCADVRDDIAILESKLDTKLPSAKESQESLVNKCLVKLDKIFIGRVDDFDKLNHVYDVVDKIMPHSFTEKQEDDLITSIVDRLDLRF